MRWIALIACLLVMTVAVAGTALATFAAVTAREAAQSEAVAKDRASVTMLAMDRYLTSATQSLDTTLASTIEAFGTSGSPDALDKRITAATGATYSMIIWPYRSDSEPGTPSFDDAIVAGNTDAAITDLFEGDISDAQGEPIAGVADLMEGGPALFAGRPIELGNKTGYVLIAKSLSLRSFEGMGVRLVEEGTQEQQSVPRGARELNLDDADVTNVTSVLYGSSDATPSVFMDLQDWDGAVAGRIVLTPPSESPDTLAARSTPPYALSVLASLAVGLPLGIVIAVVFGLWDRRFGRAG
jgi:hypothetical protein